MENERAVLSQLIQEYNESSNLERLRAKLGPVISKVDEQTLKALLRKHGYDADATADEISQTLVEKQ